MKFILKLVVYALAIWVTASILPGVRIDGYWTSLLLAAILSLLDSTIKPFMVLITIPITFVTFGLFMLVINTTIILIAERFVDEFQTDSFWWAMLFSIVLSLINSIFQSLSGNRDQK